MKKFPFLLSVILLINLSLQAVIPTYFGARNLSLGYSSMAFNYDINSIFINPALLSTINYTLSGYQYQHSYFDYKDFLDRLNEILEYNLKNYAALENNEKEILFSRLNDLFTSKHGIYGFRSNVPGVVAKDYGIAVSFVNTAIINPQQNDIFNKSYNEVSNQDIASLKMNFIGLRYTQFSMSYALNVTIGISLGISLHYLYGKITEFNTSIVDDVFSSNSSVKNYLEFGWDAADDSFYKLNADLSMAADIGKYFKLGVILKNVGNPTLVTSERDIVIERRMIAGLAFRPSIQWGIYLDIDVNKTDLFLNGEKVQLFSLGVEKGFFNNKLFVRAGLLSDLTEKYFIGSKSNILYGLGFGFNMDKIFVDFAIGIDSGGLVNNLAISAFFKFN